MSIRTHIPDEIRRASKAIGLALWLEDPDAWLSTTRLIALRLTASQRKAMAYSLLLTLNDDDFDHLMEMALAPYDMGVAA